MKKRIRTVSLSRVEGEGGFLIEIGEGQKVRVNVRIFEAPRFFESFLRGRPAADVMDFTARICGICPVAYQMSSVHAIEKIFGITVPLPIRELRRLLYCGEWIASHALHVYFLQGPDFYGLENAWSGREYTEIARRGIRFKKLGNELLSLIGGRPVHPVSVRVGGFYKTPSKEALASMVPDLERAYDESLEAIRWASSFLSSDDASETEYVSLSHPHEYPLNEGTLCSSRGLDLTMEEFAGAIQEYQVEYSTALHSGIRRNGAVFPYVVGPVARLNLNHEKLPAEIRDAIEGAGVPVPLKNIRQGIIARAVEISYALHEALRIIRDYDEREFAFVEAAPRAGSAVWATEAPRGLLIHKYELDDRGYVKHCTLIPPTSQNLSHMEKEIYGFVGRNLDKPRDFIRKETEKIIRSYDPCISCATHTVVVKDQHS